MLVRDLIAELSTVPEDMEVVVGEWEDQGHYVIVVDREPEFAVQKGRVSL